jgi:hypothetical protein
MQNTTILHPFTTLAPQKITLKIAYPQTLSSQTSLVHQPQIFK